MADKEATMYIVDLGKSMADKHHGRTESDLVWAMTYVWEKITSTVCPLTASVLFFAEVSRSLLTERLPH